MVAVTLMGREFEVAPYRLREMKAAAPFIERVNATAGALSTFEGAVAAACDMAGVLSIGLSKVDPTLTATALEEQLGMADMPDLQVAVMAILAASGLKPGEATAPSVGQPQGA